MARTSNIRILYIEDDRILCNLFQAAMRPFGYSVDVALNGEDGLALHAEAPYDVIALDFQLPDMTGIDIARKMLNENENLPIFLVTGNDSQRLITEALSIGIAQYVIKGEEDVYFKLIPSVIEQLLNRARLRQKQIEADQALIESESRFRDFAEIGADWFWELDDQLRITYISQSFTQLGVWNGSIIGITVEELTKGQPLTSEMRREIQAQKQQLPYVGVEKQSYFDPSKWVSSSALPIFDSQDRFQGYRGATTDITEIKESEKERVESAERFKDLAEGSLQGILVHRGETPLYANQSLCRIFGYKSVEEILNLTSITELADESERERMKGRAKKRTAGENISTISEFKGLKADGTPIWFETSGRSIKWGGESVAQAMVMDITDRKQAEESIAESESRFRDFAESASDFYWEFDQDLKFTYLSDSHSRITGVPKTDLIGKARENAKPPGVALVNWNLHIATLNARQPFKEFIHPRFHPDGRTVWLSTSGQPVHDSDGGFIGYRGVGRDVSTQIESETENARLASAIDSLDILVALYDPGDRLVMANKMAFEINTELGCKFQIGMTYEDLIRGFVSHGHIKNAVECEEEWIKERLKLHNEMTAPIEISRHDGRSFLTFDQTLPDGSISSVSIETTHLKEIENQLRQSQRMEAVGQLTGGIAHDFNNLLGIMMGNAEMLERHIDLDEKSQDNINEILNATERAAALTSRLLAFSRQQHLEPEASNVSELISGLENMLERTLGETISLHIGHDTDIWPSLIDPNQFENALINLSLNARDAMPNGGAININATNIILDSKSVEQLPDIFPGDYVLISIADNGEGIAKDDLEKVFEPFYTTKDVGKGSGLGLSMVHGFIKQSEGHITIESAMNKGTTVNLYVPRCLELTVSKDTTNGLDAAFTGTERILVVEDDDALRTIPASSLRGMGYEVDEASNGEEALKLFAQKKKYDLLFTDIVLPGGMNGAEIAQKIQSSQPNIKVIYTTGYAEDAISNIELANIKQNLLRKPYRQSEMLEKVRMALNAAPISDA